jgi:hypothetical protein
MTLKDKLVRQIIERSGDLPNAELFAHYLNQCTENGLRERLKTMDEDSERRGVYLIGGKKRF